MKVDAGSDAGNFIAKFPKREHDAPKWRAAIEALRLVAERGGDTMFPRIGIMRALYPGAGFVVRGFAPSGQSPSRASAASPACG